MTKVKSAKTVNKIYSGTSSKTQGQIVGARESLNGGGRGNMPRRKVNNGKKSPWGQCLTRPVPNDRRRSGFWLVPKTFSFFSAQSQASRPMGRFVYPYTECTWMAVACHVSPFVEALLEMKSSNLSTKFKGFPLDFRRESHRWIRWTFCRYRKSSVFKTLRVF